MAKKKNKRTSSTLNPAHPAQGTRVAPEGELNYAHPARRKSKSSSKKKKK